MAVPGISDRRGTGRAIWEKRSRPSVPRQLPAKIPPKFGVRFRTDFAHNRGMGSESEQAGQAGTASASPTDGEYLTELLAKCFDGDKTAADRALPMVYRELHGIAERHLVHERADHTLQPTALVHEAFLRLQSLRDIKWQSRAHFFAAASRMIRRVLVDHARTRKRKKRGGDVDRIELTNDWAEAPADNVDVLALNEALDTLAKMDERQSRIVELRFFGGLSLTEIADVFGLSTRTIKTEWSSAKAWLYHQLTRE